MDVAYNEPAMMRLASRAITAASIYLGALLGSVGLSADELPDVADRVQASVVSIVVETTRRAPPAQRKEQDADATKPNLRQGTGMVFSADGYIITVASLIENVAKITIAFSDGRQAAAQVVGRDPRTEIALLRETSVTGLTAVHFGDAHFIRRGSSIFSIGNVYGLQNSLSAAVIAAIRPSGGPLPHPLFQTDTVVKPGSTGAPLFNAKGEVIGMFTGNYSNVVGLAVTSNLIKDVAEKLQKSGVIDRGWMGVQVRKATDQDATAASLERGTGLVLMRVIDGAPAARSGLAAGDIIATFNGQPIRDVASFAWAVANQASNAEVTLGVVRKSGRSDMKVKLARLPDMETAASSTASSAPGTPAPRDLSCLRYVPSVGMTVAVACEE
jgi:serine protease Do